MKNKFIILLFLLTIFCLQTQAKVNSGQIGRIYSHAQKSTSAGQGHVYLVSKEMQDISSTMKRKLNINVQHKTSSSNPLRDSKNYKNTPITENNSSEKLSFSEVSSLIQNQI